jgi:hypothetical protein
VAGFGAVQDGVLGDVGDVVVGQGVDGLLASAGRRHQPGRAQHPEVLRGKGRRDVEVVYQLVHTAGALGEVQDDGQAMGGAERPE